MLDVRSDYRGGHLWSEREALTAPILEGVHLLRDNISEFSDTAGEKRRFLKNGGLNLSEVEDVHDTANLLL